MDNYQKKGHVAFSRDIIKKVAERKGIPEEKVKHVFNFYFKEVKLRAKKEDVFAIYLSKFLGYIYYCYPSHFYRAERALKREDLTRRVKEKYVKIMEKAEVFKKALDEDTLKRTLNGKRIPRSRHYKGNPLLDYRMNCGFTVKDLEEFQNKDL